MASIVSPGLIVSGTEMPVMRALARDKRAAAEAANEVRIMYGYFG